VLSNRKRADIEAELETQGYTRMAKRAGGGEVSGAADAEVHRGARQWCIGSAAEDWGCGASGLCWVQDGTGWDQAYAAAMQAVLPCADVGG
jgi:hypothetical protein